MRSMVKVVAEKGPRPRQRVDGSNWPDSLESTLIIRVLLILTAKYTRKPYIGKFKSDLGQATFKARSTPGQIAVNPTVR